MCPSAGQSRLPWATAAHRKCHHKFEIAFTFTQLLHRVICQCCLRTRRIWSPEWSCSGSTRREYWWSGHMSWNDESIVAQSRVFSSTWKLPSCLQSIPHWDWSLECHFQLQTGRSNKHSTSSIEYSWSCTSFSVSSQRTEVRGRNFYRKEWSYGFWIFQNSNHFYCVDSFS